MLQVVPYRLSGRIKAAVFGCAEKGTACKHQMNAAGGPFPGYGARVKA